MNKKELFEKKDKYLSVFFIRPEVEQVKEDPRYNYVIFNHVGFLMPYFGSIYELVGSMGIPMESADLYLNRNYVRIILPIELTDEVRVAMKKSIAMYSNCIDFVINVLQELKIFDKGQRTDSVDELYFALREYALNIPEVKELMKK